MLHPLLPHHQVETMAELRHPNLVRLFGFCVEGNDATEVPEQVLVYEFMPNGDLRQRMKSGVWGGNDGGGTEEASVCDHACVLA